MKKILTITFIMLSAAIWATDLPLTHFKSLISGLETAQVNGAEELFVIDSNVVDKIHQISQIQSITQDSNTHYVELFWVNQVLENIQTETSASRKRLLFANLIDTLNALANEMSNSHESSLTREEMLDALKRAMRRTTVIKAGKTSGISEFGGGGFVMEQPGEAVKIIKTTKIISGNSHATTGSSGSRHYSTSSKVNSSQSGRVTHSGNHTTNSVSSHATGKKTVVVHSAHQSASKNNAAKPFGTQDSFTRTTHVKSNSNKQTGATPDVARQSRQRQSRAVKPAPQRPPPRKKPKLPQPKKPGPGFLYWAIFILCLVAFAVVVFFIARKFNQKIKADQTDENIAETELPPERQHTATIYELALQAAANEDYAEAIRLLTIGSLLLLEEHKVVRFQDTLTNGEYLKKLLARRNLHQLFSAPMTLFDKLIYGFEQPDKNDFESFKTFYLNLEKAEK